MPDALDVVAALQRPLRAFFDPGERVFWGYLLGSVLLAWLVLGLRRGSGELVRGLVSRRIWTRGSAHADVSLLFAKAVIFAFARLPWLAATAGASLWIGIELAQILGPPEPPAWDRTSVVVVYTVILFVVWDLSRFVLHVLMHRVPVLWELHQVHHSAEVLTPLTLYRTHPLETVLYDLRGLLATAAVTGPFLYVFRGAAVELEILGINALGFLFNAVGANLRHSHVWLRFGRLERFVLSPAQHQLHHGRAIELQQSNYGTWIALWDRWLGSWRAAPAEPPTDYGVDEANHRPDRVLSMIGGPLWAVLGRVVAPVRKLLAPAAWLCVAALVSRPAEAAPETVDEEPPPPESPDPAPDAEPPAPVEPEADAEPPATVEPDADAPDDDVDFELELEPEPGPAPDATTPPDAPPAGDAAAPTDPAEPEPEPPPDPDYDVLVDEISIIGARETIGGSAYVVSDKELQRKENDDVHRALRTVPGVYTRGEDGFGLRPNIGMRGAASDRSSKVTLMEDGILLAPAPYSAPAAYYFPLMTRIAGIEVFKGPASIRHGPNTIGGAINLQTRSIPRSMQGYVDAAAGMRGYGKLHGWWGTTVQGFGVLAEGAHVQSNGFKELDTGGETGFAKNDLMLKGRWGSDPNRRFYHQVDIKTGFANETSYETYLGLTDADFAETPYRRYAASDRGRMKWWRTQGEVGYFVARGTIFDLHVRAYRHDFHRAWRKFNNFRGMDIRDVLAAPDVGQTAVFYGVLAGEQDGIGVDQALLIGTNDRRFEVTGGQVVTHVRPTWRWLEQDIEIGARVHYDEIRRRHTEDAFNMISGTLVPEGTDTATTADNNGGALAGAFHVLDTIRIKWFSMMPGARVEVIHTAFDDFLAREETSATNTVFIPGIGLHAQATSWLGFLAGVHSGFSPVSPGQPEEVEPERSINYEAGGRVLHEGKRTLTRVDAIGFFNDYSNLTSQCTISSGCDPTMLDRQFNGGRVFVYGAELLASERIGLPKGYWVEGTATYTFTGSRFRTSFTSDGPQLGEVERGDELPYVPEHQGALELGGGGRIWGLHLSGAYVGQMRDVAGRGEIPDPERIPRYFVLDATGDVWPTPRLRIYLTIQNLLDRQYMVSRRPFGARPGMPFQLAVGLKYHFG